MSLKLVFGGVFFAVGALSLIIPGPPGWNNIMDRTFMPADSCDYVVDLLQVIDSTNSVFDTIGTARSDLTELVKILKEKMDDSRIATTTFRDKDIPPLGYRNTSWTDDCFEVQSDFEQTSEVQVAALNSVYVAGGYDFPEGQLEALLRGAIAPQVKWRKETHNAQGLPIIKTIVLSTDSIAHRPMNATDAVIKLNEEGANLPIPLKNELTAADLIDNPNAGCGTLEYPSLEYLREVFDSERIIPIFLLAPAHFPCDKEASGFCKFPEMVELYKATGNEDYLDPVKGMVTFYTDVAKQLGRPAVIETLGDGFAGFSEKFKEALIQLEWILCESVATTPFPDTTTTTEVTHDPIFPEPTTTTETTTVEATKTDDPAGSLWETSSELPPSTPLPSTSFIPSTTEPTSTDEICTCEEDVCACVPKIHVVVNLKLT